jgi:glycosyltransferase involved in cell wall biosynthesis
VNLFPPLQGTPGVSYIMPVLNEAEHVTNAVNGILGQRYAGEQEIVLALGASTDATNEIVAELAAADPRVRWVDNPANDVPIGLNLAIAATRHPVVIRVDAHSELPPDYAEKMVAKLSETGAANVGGVMRARGETPLQAAIARAYNSPFGMGGASYHSGTAEGPSDSAYLGVFRREIFDIVGPFDESLRRAQDWEFNLRIRQAGYLIWFTPEVAVDYWPRGTLDKLRRQMYATGVWRGHLARRGGATLKHWAPPVLVLGLGNSLLLLLLRSKKGLALPLAYAAGIGAVGLQMKPSNPLDWALNVAVLACVHLSWGAGFIRGWCFGAESTKDRSRVAGSS